MYNMDSLDKKILYELDLNARASASQLAKKLRRNKETVNFRLNRLLERQYIKGFYGVFNTSKLGWYYYKVYVKFKNITPAKEKELFNYIQKQPNIAYLGSLEGAYSGVFLVMVKAPGDMLVFLNPFMETYGKFVQEKAIHTVLVTHRLNQKFLFNDKKREDWHYGESLENYCLDEVDKGILNLISTKARMPLTDIAKELGVDHKVVKYRLNKLEKDRIILAYVSAPNFDVLGTQFVQINISLRELSTGKSMINYFDSTNKCLFALELLGKYDLSVELHVNGAEELKTIIDGFRVKFVNKYNDYDVSTMTKEYVVVWTPFS